MCGICGWLNFDPSEPVAAEALGAMLRSMVHRGPDDEGRLLEANVGIGMRRLSIIDLAGGHQPIANEDGRLQIVFNGEIYNYVELREELVRAGHRFTTRSDTETILHGYEEWGLGVLPKLNGMFAFAIWDRAERSLFIARDRAGIKPLFYCLEPHRFTFGSELKAVLAAGVPTDVDLGAVRQFLAHWYVPTPRSIYQGIAKLEPGCWLRVGPNGMDQGRYWNLGFSANAGGRSQADYDAELETILKAAVERQMRSDVEVGAFLSGGLDSSIVTRLMAPLTDHQLRTYTIGFAEESYAEQDVAEQIAAAIGTNHHTELMGPESLALFPALAAHFDEPFGDYSLLPTQQVSALAARQVKVVLTGDGGDEVFAGYPTHFVWRFARLYRRLPGHLRRVIARRVEAMPTSMDRISLDYALKRFVRGAELSAQRGHYAWKEILSRDEQEALFVPEVWAQVKDEEPYDAFARYFAEVADQPLLNQVLYVDFKTFLLDDNLVKVDRMSMQQSLEVRVPLLDNEVIDWAAGVPPEVKLPGRKTKPLLRRLATRILPPGVAGLKKRGFTPPLPLWLQGPGRALFDEALSPAALAELGVFRPETVARMRAEHEEGRRDWNRPLMALLSYSLWARRSRQPLEA